MAKTAATKFGYNYLGMHLILCKFFRMEPDVEDLKTFSISRVYQNDQVYLHVDYMVDSVFVSRLEVTERFKGHGSRAMKFLADTADNCGAIMELFPEPIAEVGEPHLPLTRLMAFYRRFGFRFIVSDELMRRIPMRPERA